MSGVSFLPGQACCGIQSTLQTGRNQFPQAAASTLERFAEAARSRLDTGPDDALLSVLRAPLASCTPGPRPRCSSSQPGLGGTREIDPVPPSPESGLAPRVPSPQEPRGARRGSRARGRAEPLEHAHSTATGTHARTGAEGWAPRVGPRGDPPAAARYRSPRSEPRGARRTLRVPAGACNEPPLPTPRPSCGGGVSGSVAGPWQGGPTPSCAHRPGGVKAATVETSPGLSGRRIGSLRCPQTPPHPASLLQHP